MYFYFLLFYLLIYLLYNKYILFFFKIIYFYYIESFLFSFFIQDSEKYFDIIYYHKFQLYKIRIKKRERFISPILQIINQSMIKVDSRLTPYMGPYDLFYSIPYSVSDFKYKELEFHLSNGDIIHTNSIIHLNY
jgi:hypothetical protein